MTVIIIYYYYLVLGISLLLLIISFPGQSVMSDKQRKRRNSAPSPSKGGSRKKPNTKTASRTHKEIIRDAKNGKELEKRNRANTNYDEEKSVVDGESDRNPIMLTSEKRRTTRAWTVNIFVESSAESSSQVHSLHITLIPTVLTQ